MQAPSHLPAPIDDGACAHLPGLVVPSLLLPSTAGRLIDLSKRDAAHRVAKPRRIEALTWHGAYFDASVLGFAHVVTKLLLHRHLFFGRTGAR